MSDAITLRLDSAPVLARLNEIARRFDDLSPAMRGIGEALAESTKQRFSTSTAPDGQKWKPNVLATVLGRLSQISGAYSAKTGHMTKKGASAFIAKKPLVDTGVLQDTIRYQLVGNKSVEIGTNRFAGEWEGGAAVHQFGTDRAGRGGKVSIPARPFLGLSASDEAEVLEILDRFLEQSLGK